MPFWWEAHKPTALPEVDLPKDIPVAIVGAGYAGMNAAIELAKNGIESIVLDAAEPGFGGSTRNGGLVSAGVNVGKSIINKALTPEQAKPFLNDAVDAFTNIENLVSENGIECGWTKSGYFLGAWCQSHYDAMAKKVDLLNEEAQSGAFMVPREIQRAEIGSDYYFGGMHATRAGHLHPALYYKGLLEAAHRAGAILCAQVEAEKLEKIATGWRVLTPKGPIECREVVVATNGYTGDLTPRLKRRVVPVASHIIATEELPEPASKLIPEMRAIGDTKRVLTYYRPSPDGTRLIFGGRARFTAAPPEVSAPALYQSMIDRFPQLDGIRITHVWTGNVAFALDYMPHMGTDQGVHYLLACNGNGVAMMTYLGTETARKIAGGRNVPVNPLDGRDFPEHALYNGDPSWFLPIVGAWYRTRDWLDRRMAA